MPPWSSARSEAPPLAELPHAQTAFLDLLGRLRVDAGDRATLAAMLREPWRLYHGAGHVGLLWQRHLEHGGDPEDAVAAHAIAYHDAIYRPGARDNEANSAALWREHAAALPATLRDRVEVAIMATADHAADHADTDALWLVDLDLTPLGEPWPYFLANSRRLREEMGVADGAPVPGQFGFLRRLLDLPRIYRSPRHASTIATTYEATARRNLDRVLGAA